MHSSKQIVPNIIHFIFGLASDFGGRPFSFIHYVNIKSAIEVNKPEQAIIYYHFEPKGEWWDKTIQLNVELVKVNLPTSQDGRDLQHYAHRAGILRLNILKEKGGIYLDTDVFCIRPFTIFLNDFCTIGSQGENANDAVIMATPESEFIRYWLEFYKTFYPQREHDHTWEEVAVFAPTKLEKIYPNLVKIVPNTYFHNPDWNNCNHFFQSGENLYPDSYCHHLWETCNWHNLCNLTPETLDENLYLHKLIKERYLCQN